MKEKQQHTSFLLSDHEYNLSLSWRRREEIGDIGESIFHQGRCRQPSISYEMCWQYDDDIVVFMSFK